MVVLYIQTDMNGIESFTQSNESYDIQPVVEAESIPHFTSALKEYGTLSQTSQITSFDIPSSLVAEANVQHFARHLNKLTKATQTVIWSCK